MEKKRLLKIRRRNGQLSREESVSKVRGQSRRVRSIKSETYPLFFTITKSLANLEQF